MHSGPLPSPYPTRALRRTSILLHRTPFSTSHTGLRSLHPRGGPCLLFPLGTVPSGCQPVLLEDPGTRTGHTQREKHDFTNSAKFPSDHQLLGSVLCIARRALPAPGRGSVWALSSDPNPATWTSGHLPLEAFLTGA